MTDRIRIVFSHRDIEKFEGRRRIANPLTPSIQRAVKREFGADLMRLRVQRDSVDILLTSGESEKWVFDDEGCHLQQQLAEYEKTGKIYFPSKPEQGTLNPKVFYLRPAAGGGD